MRRVASLVLALGSGWAGAQVGAAPGGGLLNVEAVAVGAGKVYAVDQRGDSLVVVDEATGARRRVRVGKEPEAVVVNAATGRVYVANRGDGTVTVLDGNAKDGGTEAVVATVAVGSRPFAMAVDATTNRVYVSRTFSDEIAEVDGATNGVVSRKGMSADQMQVAPGGGALLLTGYEGDKLHRWDEATWTDRTELVGGHNWGMAVVPGAGGRGGAVWVPLLGSDAVAVLDGKGGRVVVPVGHLPCAVAVDAGLGSGAGLWYVVNYGDATLSVVDAAARRVVTTVKVGAHPQAVAVDARRHRVYVANMHGDSVTVVDGRTGAVLGTRAAGEHPYALAVSEATGKVGVANLPEKAGSAVVTVLDGR